MALSGLSSAFLRDQPARHRRYCIRRSPTAEGRRFRCARHGTTL